MVVLILSLSPAPRWTLLRPRLERSAVPPRPPPGPLPKDTFSTITPSVNLPKSWLSLYIRDIPPGKPFFSVHSWRHFCCEPRTRFLAARLYPALRGSVNLVFFSPLLDCFSPLQPPTDKHECPLMPRRQVLLPSRARDASDPHVIFPEVFPLPIKRIIASPFSSINSSSYIF